jgi:hypothetical protein
VDIRQYRLKTVIQVWKVAHHLPGGEQLSIYDASKYKQEVFPVITLKDYALDRWIAERYETFGNKSSLESFERSIAQTWWYGCPSFTIMPGETANSLGIGEMNKHDRWN